MDYPNLPSGYQDPMQYRQLHNLPYPSPEGQNKMGSSAQYRSDAITSPNVHGHPFIARQPSASNREINLEGFASSSGNYLPPLQQPDLYTASAQFDQDALRLPRSSTIHPHASPQSWPPYEHPIPLDVALSLRYDSFPSPSPFPPPRLSPPSYSNGGLSRGIHPLAGSLDPATGVFYRTPDHPRLRTAQACEKCRTRKAKCSGEHPSCKRCIARGLVCEYAKEGRVRGPNKPKLKPPPTTVAATDEPFSLAPSRARTMSANDSTSTSGNSSEHHDVASILSSFRANETRLGAPSFSGVPGSSQARRNSLSLDEHRPNRSRPPNLHLDTASNHDRRIGVPILQPSPGNSLYWTERVGAQYTQDSVRHEYQQSPRNDLPIPEVQGLSYPSHNFPGPEPTVVPPFARFPLSLQPTIDLNGQYLGSGFDLAGSSATEGGTDTSTLMRYQQSQQISVCPVPETSSVSHDLNHHNIRNSIPGDFASGPFTSQGEYLPVEFETLNQHADAPRNSMPQDITPNLTPTWVEISPTSVPISGIETNVPSSGLSTRFSSSGVHTPSDVKGTYRSNTDHSPERVSAQDSQGVEGSTQPRGQVSHPSYQLDLRMD